MNPAQPATASPLVRAAAFHSILFEHAEDRRRADGAEAPACFRDLNIDQIVDAITANKQEYDLKPFFYVPLATAGAISYRHEIMRDLEDRALFGSVKAFAQRMRDVRERLAQADKLYYKYQKESWFLEAAEAYGDAVDALARDLDRIAVRARGLLAFRDYVRAYVGSARFGALLADLKRVKAGLAGIDYCVLIRGDSFTVRHYGGETDYSADVLRTFARFKQGAVKSSAFAFPDGRGMNHVEAAALDFVARLHPDAFGALDDVAARHGDFQDDTIRAFDREIQFYVAYLEYTEALRRAGLRTCYPRVTDDRRVYGRETYDVALAQRLVAEGTPVVCNDFHLEGAERIFVVSGPNQGGKTTFARAFGQLHYLASLGCPVAGAEAQTALFDRLLTHFEKEEDIANLRGKLEDDLARIHGILSQATPRSIVVMNEIFTSTALEDAVFLSRQVIDRIMQLDLLCVCVTFIDELSRLGEKTVSMVSTVVPENPAVRTYKILRRPADGLAYAISIAEKHRVTYAALRERIRP